MSETNLTDFLLARIAEDEAVARDKNAQPPWIEVGYPRGSYFIGCDDRGGTYLSLDPARVLAECAAKRGAIEAAWDDLERIESEWGSGKGRDELSAKDDNPAVIEWLALPYADHPDYRQEWKPEGEVTVADLPPRFLPVGHPDAGPDEVGIWTEETGTVNLTVTAVKGEPCPRCGEPQDMTLRIDLGERGGDVVEPFDRYLCEACCPPILHPPVGGFTLGEKMSERVVTYEGSDLHLSVEEYEALRLAALDDPAEAERMSLAFLRREQEWKP